MTRQEAFDIMVKHLRQQGCRAISNGVCRYRGDNGTKCAVGALISDEQYERMTRNTGNEWALRPTAELIGMSGDDRDFLREVQKIHDGVDLKDWDEQLREVAAEYNLIYPEN